MRSVPARGSPGRGLSTAGGRSAVAQLRRCPPTHRRRRRIAAGNQPAARLAGRKPRCPPFGSLGVSAVGGPPPHRTRRSRRRGCLPPMRGLSAGPTAPRPRRGRSGVHQVLPAPTRRGVWTLWQGQRCRGPGRGRRGRLPWVPQRRPEDLASLWAVRRRGADDRDRGRSGRRAVLLRTASAALHRVRHPEGHAGVEDSTARLLDLRGDGANELCHVRA